MRKSAGERPAQSTSLGTAAGARKRETVGERSARAGAIAKILAGAYPEVKCPLVHENAFELLIAVILSAQCTDAAVNKVTPELFRRYPTAQALSSAPTAEIESLIRSLGLYRTKARALKRCAQPLVSDGKPPTSFSGTPLTSRGLPLIRIASGWREGSDCRARRTRRRSKRIS